MCANRLTCNRFLWVYFQLKSICAESTDEAILEALDHLPRDMPETIRRFLKKLDLRSASSRDLCRRIFEILAACRRPLTLQELRDAVSVVPGLKRWDTKRFVNNIDKAVDCCGSLLMVDEEQSTVHFVHHSVKQYLLDNVASTDSGVYHVDATEADLTLGEVCVTYLSFDSLSMQLTRIETPTSPDIGTLPSAIIDRILPPSTSKRLALKLLKDRKSNYDFNSQLKSMTASNQGLRNQQTSGQVLQHPFLSYAQEHWLVHSRGFWHETQLTYPLWKELIAGERSTVTLPWHKTFAADPFVTPRNPAHAHSRYGAYLIPWDRIAWASAHDHGPIAWEALHELQSHILELPKDVFEDLATSMLHECRNFKGKYYAPALLLACSMQSIDHALQLLKHGVGADINSQDFRGQTPLMCAASCPHVQLVKRLLAANANVRMVDHSGRTVLHVAVEADYGIVDPEDGRLVFSRVPPDPITESTDVIELLLAHHDTDVNAKYPVVDEFGVVGFRTALGQAVARGLDGVVQLLLEHPDIEVNSRDLHSEKYIPSLTPNSDTGHMPPYPPWTPLQTAAYKGDVRVLRLLLGRNEVDINIEDDNSRTALHLAVANRHRDVVTILLTRPNIIRSRYQGWDKRTAYDWAVARDDKTAMDIIIRQ